MDWRILAVALPLLGFLQVPEVSAQANSDTTNFNLTFTVQQLFNAMFLNSSLDPTKYLNSTITTQINSLYQAKYSSSFLGLLIQQFGNNSGVVVNGLLQFNSSATKPSVADLTQVFLNGITNKNLTITVTNTSISIVDLSTPATPPPTVSYNFTVSIAATFLPAYANLSNPVTIAFINNVTTQISSVYSNIFPNFISYTIFSLSNGSVIVNGALVFANTSTIPNVTTLLSALNAAIASGNFTFVINSISFAGITLTASTTATPTVTAVTTSLFKIVFSIVDTFNSSLSNLSSAQAIALTSKVTTQIGGVYQKAYSNFNKMTVLSYSNGSIVTNGTLFFFSNGSIPSVKSLLSTLLSAIANNTLGFTINPQSIIITDSSGNVASGSPVMATMFTALWMTLMSLLLSAVMHY